MQVWSLGREDPPKEAIAAHSSILARKTHGQRSLMDPRGHRVELNWIDWACTMGRKKCKDTHKKSQATGSHMKESRWRECWSKFIVCNLLTLLLTIFCRRGQRALRHWENISERNTGLLGSSAMPLLLGPRMTEMGFPLKPGNPFQWECCQSGRGHVPIINHRDKEPQLPWWTTMFSRGRVAVRMFWSSGPVGVPTWWQGP